MPNQLGFLGSPLVLPLPVDYRPLIGGRFMRIGAGGPSTDADELSEQALLANAQTSVACAPWGSDRLVIEDACVLSATSLVVMSTRHLGLQCSQAYESKVWHFW